MAMEFQRVVLKDISRGIDARSAQNSIEPGYSEDLVNCDTNSQGVIPKRKGYQGHYGYVPLRATELIHNGTDITFCFDSSVNLLNEAPSPIVAYGKSSDSTAAGDFTTTDAVEYYSTFSVEARKDLALGTIPLNHNLASDKLLVGITESTSATNLSNNIFIPDGATYTKAGNDATFTVSGGSGDGFVYVADKTTVAGNSYAATFVTGDTTPGLAPYWTGNVLTITAATHNLSNVNIIPQIFQDVGGTDYELVKPDRATILANGDLEIELTAPIDGQVVLSDAEPDNVSEIGATAGSTTTVTTTVTSGSAFFTAVYLRDEVTGDRELVIPESIVYDSTTNQITFTVIPTSTGVVQTMFEAGTIIANCITVTDNSATSDTYTDLEPQITIWGISHENLYSDSTRYGGHLTHIDSYRRELESRIICGLGGNIFASRTRAEVGTSYNIPSSSVSLAERTDTLKAIGPFFHNTSDSTDITRAVQGSNITDNFVEITQAEYVSTGVMKFHLNITGKTGVLSGLTTDDKVTVNSMAYSVLNGSHDILSTSDVDNTITVSISAVTTSDFEELGACGKLGVFTDTLTLGAASPFSINDVLLSNIFDGLATPTVTKSDGTTITFTGATEEVDVPGGLLLRAERTGTLVPLASVTNFVKGDMMTVTGFDREFRVLSVDTSANTLTIDEAITFSQTDGTPFSFTVTGRWIPIEVPTDGGDQVKQTYIKHFHANDYDNQGILRSTMVSNNMYFANGSDEIYKFDGSELYRAGLPRWQPHLFTSLETSGSQSITMPDAYSTVTADSTTDTVAVGSNALFARDQSIVINGAIYIVASLEDTDKVIFKTAVSVLSGDKLRPLRRLQYYFRLNAIDKNQNIVSSATVGSNDFIVDMVDDANVNLKLVGLPLFDAYDYETLEIKIFRADFVVGEFLEVNTLEMSFDEYKGYITYTDNRNLDENDPSIADETNFILAGDELGNGWNEPLRAKFMTSSSSRLVLGNVRDYPELNIQLRKTTGSDITTSNLNGKRILFRKDSTDTGTTSNMIDRVAIEFINSGADTVSSAADNGSGLTTFTMGTPLPAQPAIGDWLYFYYNTPGIDKNLSYSGWYQVTASVSASEFTVNAPYAGVVSIPDRCLAASASGDIPVFIGTDGNYNTSFGNSSLSYERLAMIRAANAINSAMRMCSTANFIPWLNVRAGDEIGSGNLVVRQPNSNAEIIAVSMPSNPTNGQWLVNDNSFSGTKDFTALERVFNSRVILSQQAPYNDIFDGPFGLEQDSSDVYDIDPADGQQITGIINFFATAPFSGSQREDMLVVFKENSIHVVSTNTQQTRRLETQGVGCSFPYTIAYSRNGIIFAHESGIYRLDKDLNISYVGKFVERLWQDNIVKNNLSRATATHYSIGRQYKLSIPYGDSQVHNNGVLVYDHTRETDDRVEYGAWTRYDNHPVTGWTNLENDAYFGTSNGQVFKLRNLGEKTDYRDDADAIVQDIILAALDFGIPGVTKIVKDITMQYQLRHSDLTGTTIQASVNLDNVFRNLDSFTITRDTNVSGLDSTVQQKVKTIRYDVPRKVLEYLQIRATNNQLDEDMILAGLTISITARSSATLTTAAKSE